MAGQVPQNHVTPRPGSNGMGVRGRSSSSDWMETCSVKPAMSARLHLFAEAWAREVETRFRALASQRRGPGMHSGRGAATIPARDLRSIIDAFYPYFDALVKLLLRDAGWDMTTRLHIGQVRYFLCNYVRCLTEAERGEDILLQLKER